MKTRVLFMFVSLLTGCAAILGVPDLTFDPDSTQGRADGSTSDGSPNDGGAPGFDSGPSTPCDETKLQTDTKHCGRCGHDCLGGACTAGKCEPVVVQGGLTNPTTLVFDSTNLYVTSNGDGTVRRIPKGGGQVDVLARAQKNVHGIALDGQNLYWSNLTFGGDGGDGYWGGVWHCELPACSTKTSVVEAEYAGDVQYANGTLYFAENNDNKIRKVQPNGTGLTTLAEPNKPLYLAVDSEHVYFTTKNTTLKRVPIVGGMAQEVGPIEYGGEVGFVRLDAERVYWAYSGYDPPYIGYVYGQSKSDLSAPKIVYGTANQGSIGVAVDDTNIYWTNGSVTDIGASLQRVGTILTCPKTGCVGEPTVVASSLLAPGALAIDGAAIYFLSYGSRLYDADGALLRVAKP
jgi:hypothetical protein